MKKIIGILAAAVSCFFTPVYVFAQGSVNVTIKTNLPGPNPASFCGTLFNFYDFALMIGGILAFGAIVYGGVKYTLAAGNPSGQSEGKDWVKSALLGLLLLVAAYLILNTINPALTQCNITVETPVASPIGPPIGPNDNPNVVAALNKYCIGVVTANTAGTKQSTIDALVDLRTQCSGPQNSSACSSNPPITVTSLTGGAHSTSGGCTHANGYKADVRPNAALDSCITGTSNGFTRVGTRADGAPLYKAPDGAIYADERTRPPNCGTPCDWTAPHWDINACSVP